jgi:hypothetical protein
MDKKLYRKITIEGEVEDEHTKFLWGNADIVNVEISPPGQRRLSSAILRTDAEKAVKNQADFLAGKECRHVAWTATPGKSQCLTCGIIRTQNPNGTWGG